MYSNKDLIAEAREFLATPNLGKPLMRELDKAMIYLRRLADALEAATSERDAVPDAATERASQAEAELRDMLRVDIPSLKAERDAALAAVGRVRELHQAREDGWCSACAETNDQTGEFQDFPCPTIVALDGAPETATTEPEPNQYAPCFINGNRNLSILGTVNSVREYAENEAQMLRDNEAAYPNGTPEAIVLAARYVGPWLPVEGGSNA